MAENSLISWTDNTVNVWIGCNEVRLYIGSQVQPSECDNCYAKYWARVRRKYDGHDADHPVIWGNPKHTPRIETKYWRKALVRWNKDAWAHGRLLVFAFSLSDWAEEHPMVGPWRNDFIDLIEQTPFLDYLLLTKRPQNALRMLPTSWRRNWPQHVWLGTSAGNQVAWDRRVPWLDEWAAVGVPVRFVSDEPTLEAIDPDRAAELRNGIVNWVISGGESGSDDGIDRPRVSADMGWFRAMRDICVANNVAFFHKQHGGRLPGGDAHLDGRQWHQWPDTAQGRVGGVRALPGAELIAA